MNTCWLYAPWPQRSVLAQWSQKGAALRFYLCSIYIVLGTIIVHWKIPEISGYYWWCKLFKNETRVPVSSFSLRENVPYTLFKFPTHSPVAFSGCINTSNILGSEPRANLFSCSYVLHYCSAWTLFLILARADKAPWDETIAANA